MNDTHVIILAGGKGTRMKCDTPKCLTMLGDKPFLERVLSSCSFITKQPTIIIGYKGDEVVKTIGDGPEYVLQEEQLGTGHAVGCAKDSVAPRGYKYIMVLMGDQPLVSEATLHGLLESHMKADAVITASTIVVPNFENEYAPFLRFGRILRGEDGSIVGNIEYKDATEEQREELHEVGINTFIFDADFLWSHVGMLSDDNAAGELYVTDFLGMAFREGKKVAPFVVADIKEALGVNSLEDLEIAKKFI